MKSGRFRKGKKAFKKGQPSRLFNQYLIHIERIRQRKIAALNATMATITASFGMQRIAMIQALKFDSPTRKALELAHEIINMSEAIPKAFRTFN